jgi:hypothetical protein
MSIVSLLPVTLQNGQIADATQVMADMNQIVNNVNANAAALNGNNAFLVGTTQTIGGDVIVTQTATQTLTNKTIPGYNPVLTSISLVRALLKTGSPQVLVTGYYTPFDGGGGEYCYDPTDTTSADNGGTIIVAADGGRWKLVSTGAVSVKQFGAVADGATDNASVFALAATAIGANGTLVFNGTGTFNYSGGLAFSTPVKLKATNGAILNYTGTGKAITLGPTNIALQANADYGDYVVDGLTFTGGASMTHGIFVPSWVLFPKIRHCKFYRFGNATAYAIWAAGMNWQVLVESNEFLNDQAVARNFLRTDGFAAGLGYDSGNSHLTCVNNNISATSGFSVGVGISHTGAGDIITGNKIEGFAPNIRSGSSAARSTIADNYFEVIAGNCIEFGDVVGGYAPGTFLANLSISNNNCNMHATDGVGNTGSFVAPTTGNTAVGIQYSTVRDNKLSNASAVVPVVVLNNVASQTGNYGTNNTNGLARGVPYLRSIAPNLTAWLGEGPQALGLAGGVSSFASPQVASATLDTNGVVHLCGCLKATTTSIAGNNTLAFLPAGYFPSRQTLVPVYDAVTLAVTYLVVSTGGGISIGLTLASTSQLDLNGVSFSLTGN